MSSSTSFARTSGAKRAGPGEYVFELTKMNHIRGGPGYSSASGACVEGDRIMVGLMRVRAGTGAVMHSHPNEQWIFILEGTYKGDVNGKDVEAKPGSVIYIPANVLHSGGATAEGDLVFFTFKDGPYGMHGIRA
jgi:quercetin dioxygenase-like cupin family protein